MKRFFFPIIILLLFVSCQKEVYYNISTTINPKDAGSISVSPAGPSVLEGTSVTVAAQPKGEYVFTGWSGSLSGTDNPKTISVTSDLNITANFALKEYPLSISVEGEGAVSEKVISTKTDYTSGTIVELTAKAADHWLFDHWEGDLSGNKNPAQITISSAKNVKAVFVKKMYDLSVEVQGEGTVKESVVQTKSTSYQEGTVIELTAQPSDHWVFDHWDGDLSGDKNPAQVTLSSAKKVKAFFVEKMYPLTVEVEGNGAVNEEVISTKSGVYQEGSVIELTASPADHWVFDHWEGDLEGSQNPSQIAISSAKTVKAVFIEKMYPLTVEVQGGGAVNEELVGTKSNSYQEGSVVQLTATPNTYWAFDHWEGDVTGTDNPALITISDAATVKAVFVEHDPGIVFTETEYISPYEINKRMGMGWNLACHFEAYREIENKIILDETWWGNPECTQELFFKVAEKGFKSVRIPITWVGSFGPGPDYIIDEKRLNRIAEVVSYVENAGMIAILNMHGDNASPDPEGDYLNPNAFWINPTRAAQNPAFNDEVKNRIKSLWTQIARKFRDKGDFLMFESFNEPGGSGYYWSWPNENEEMSHLSEYQCINEWNQLFVDAVRSTGGNNARRWLVVVGGGAKERHLKHFVLPNDYVSNNRLMIAIHVYEPESYVFGNITEWGHTAQVINEEIWRFDETFLANEFKKYRENYMDQGVPLCIDEISCFNRDNDRETAFQLYYLEYLVRAATINGFATFIWDNGGRIGGDIRGQYLLWHSTGDYVNDVTKHIVDILYRASYSDDPDYTLESVYASAPFQDPEEDHIIDIPDPHLKEYLVEKYDRNNDGEIQKKECWRVHEIEVNTQVIRTMNGIEHFQNLEVLVCRGREEWVPDEFGPGLLTELDVTHNPHLKRLEFNNNHITSIDLSHNTELESICGRSNSLISLDISHNPVLTDLDMSTNHIGSMDFSNTPRLKSIYARGNELTVLDVSTLQKLETLNIGGNHLKEIDLTNNYLLRSLECDGNDLAVLDLSYNKYLEYLLCTGNPSLKTVYVAQGHTIPLFEKDSFTQFTYREGINIKDMAFKKYLVDRFDADGDNEISEAEAATVTEIEVCTDNIFSLNGIEHFANLKRLVCMGTFEEEYSPNNYHGVLSELNVSHNLQLEFLSCGYNQLNNLDVSKNKQLKILRFQNNNVTSIDVSNNHLLEDLDCRYCHITSLDLSYNHELVSLDCQGGIGYNRIKSIDVSGCPRLSLMNCNSVGLETIDVTHNPDLHWLGCVDSYFTTIDLSFNPHLNCFYGNAVSLSELDLTHNLEMEYLYIQDSPKLHSVYLKTGQIIPHIYKDDHTQIVYK